MKHLGYFFVRYWISAVLFCYYKKIRVLGKEKIPLKKPVLFLSNHQNALLDVLLIATRCNRKPWFLTRSDVFKNRLLNSLFGFLQMLPIYRIRDGKANLHKNRAIFKKCGQLLGANQSLLLFPEANHSLKRRVRPLSKGFTRIITAALEQDPNLDIQLVPVGQNYAYPTKTGDASTICFGKPIAVQHYIDAPDFVFEIKEKVTESLEKLTTHIPEDKYVAMVQKIGEEGEVYQDPKYVNTMIGEEKFIDLPPRNPNLVNKLLRSLFTFWNLPLVLLWRYLIKPKVPEPEFMATFRFGFVLLAYPLIYGLSLFALSHLYSIKMAHLFVFGHAILNILLVKLGITSSDRRK